MKKILVMLLVFCGLSFAQTLKFANSPDYPPFDYIKDANMSVWISKFWTLSLKESDLIIK